MPSTSKGREMYFFILVKFKKKPTKEMIEDNLKRTESEAKEGITTYSAFGRSEDMKQITLVKPKRESIDNDTSR
jgi:hypothetical protein